MKIFYYLGEISGMEDRFRVQGPRDTKERHSLKFCSKSEIPDIIYWLGRRYKNDSVDGQEMRPEIGFLSFYTNFSSYIFSVSFDSSRRYIHKRRYLFCGIAISYLSCNLNFR